MIDQLSHFKFSLSLQMRWSDLDALGHVNNALFPTYFELARSQFMIDTCPGWDWEKDMFLMANVNINFHKEMLLTTENPRVMVRTGKMGNKSFVLEYAVIGEKNGRTEVYASGTTTQVMIDLKERSTIQIPEWVRSALQAYKGI